MKTGITLQELAKTVQDQQQGKRDFLAPSRRLTLMEPGEEREGFGLSLGDDGGAYGVTDWCHGQIGSRLSIPAKYYNRMRTDAPALLSRNVNHWLHGSEDKRMVRTLGGNARAFLSDRYRPLDNFDLAEVVLPVLAGSAGLSIVSSQVTERRMYIKAVNERVTGEVKQGDVVQAGVCISNSEVGCGALSIQPLVFRLVCLNGMVMADGSLRKYHAGRRAQGGGEEVLPWERLSDEARQASDKAIWLAVRDLTRSALDEAIFTKVLGRLQEAAGQTITKEPEAVVDATRKRFGMTEAEGDGILRHLLGGGDFSAWGLGNAITRLSQDVDDYDRATELERAGGKVIELAPSEWKTLATASAN